MLLFFSYDEMSFSDSVYSQDNSCYDRVWTLLSYIQIQSMYCESYQCNLCISEIIQIQSKVSHIYYTEALSSITSSELCKSMKQSSDHHTLNAITHQSSSHSCILVAQ